MEKHKWAKDYHNEAHEKARQAVRDALRRGAIDKGPCEMCGFALDDSLIEGHHHLGYEKEHWLDVQWLCARCHIKVDSVRRAFASGDWRLLAVEQLAANQRRVDELCTSLPPEPWDLSDKKVASIMDELTFYHRGLFGECADDDIAAELIDYEGFMDTYPEVYDGAEGWFAPDPWEVDRGG